MPESIGNTQAFSDRLREALKLRGMRAAGLSEKTGIPKGAISYYITGKSKPKADRLYIIARALDISEAWLLGYDVPMGRTDNQKKNDQLAELVMRLKTDEGFYNSVAAFAALDEKQYRGIEQLLVTLSEKPKD